jgi:hypothetical protein
MSYHCNGKFNQLYELLAQVNYWLITLMSFFAVVYLNIKVLKAIPYGQAGGCTIGSSSSPTIVRVIRL